MSGQEPTDRATDREEPAPANGAEDLIVGNLMEALTRLHNDLDRVELWTAALGCFLRPVPDYRPSDEHLLPPLSRAGSRGGKW